MQLTLMDIEHSRAVWEERTRHAPAPPAAGRSRRRIARALIRLAVAVDREAVWTTPPRASAAR
jgi:hypothetical protein